MEAIRSKMSTTTFFSRQGAQRNGFGTIQHKVEFQRTNEARIEHLSFIMNSHAVPSLPETGDRPLSKGHPFLIAKHAQALCHGAPHLVPDTGNGIAGIGPGEDLFDVVFPILHHAVADTGLRKGFRILSRTTTRPAPEHHGIQQGIRSESIPAVETQTRGFSGRKQAGNALPSARKVPAASLHVRLHPAHDIVHARAHGNRFFGQIDIGKRLRLLENLAEALPDESFAQMPAIEQHAAVDPPAFIDLDLLGARHHVTRGQLHHVRSILLHETLTLGIQQIGAFPSSRLTQEQSFSP